MNSFEPEKKKLDVLAYQHSRYATRCMVCGTLIKRGTLICTPADGNLVSIERKSKARWAHPACMKRAINERLQITKQVSKDAYASRKARKAKRRNS
jgi:predicted nucleic acid-binding Zn ribbon protein